MLDLDEALEIAIPFLKLREGFRASAYQDGGGVWTIGYGHTADVKPGDKVTQVLAGAMLEQDSEDVAAEIVGSLPDTLNPNQFAALISFTYNVGPGRMGHKDGFLVLKSGQPSTLLRLIREIPDPSPDQLKTVGDQFLHWIYVNGEPSSGLCTRRTCERELYMSPYLTPKGT